MDAIQEEILPIKCPKCSKALPLTIIEGDGQFHLSVFCKHCKKVSIIKVKNK